MRITWPATDVAVTVVALTCVVLLALLTYLAVRRPNRRWLAARLVANSIIVLALAGLALQPTLINTGKRQRVVLLTEGYDPKQIDSLRQAFGKNILTLGWQGAAAGSAQTQAVNMATLQEYVSSADTVYVLGYGLPAEVRTALNNCYWRQLPITHRPELQHVQWPATVQVGNWFTLHALFENKTAKPVRLQLSVPGTILADSAAIKAGEAKSIALHLPTKTTGPVLAVFNILEGNRIVLRDTVVFAVLPARKLNILLLESTPSFETKYLRNALAQQGHAITVRTQVSRDAYQYQWLNTPQQPIEMTAAALAKFDLILADNAALAAGVTQQNVLQAVRDGLGVVLLDAGSTAGNPSALYQMFKARVSGVDTEPVPFYWTSETVIGTVTLKTGTRFELQPFQKNLMADAAGNALVVQTNLGAGSVIALGFAESYALLLQNRQTDYAALWAHLLGATVRQQTNTLKVRAANFLPRVQVPLTLNLQTNAAEAALVKLMDATGDSVLVPLRQSAIDPAQWTGSYWPRRPGWHQVRHQDLQTWFYVYPDSAWHAMELQHRYAASRVSAEQQQPTAASTADKRPTTPTPISLFWFWGLLLAALTFLWVERKL